MAGPTVWQAGSWAGRRLAGSVPWEVRGQEKGTEAGKHGGSMLNQELGFVHGRLVSGKMQRAAPCSCPSSQRHRPVTAQRSIGMLARGEARQLLTRQNTELHVTQQPLSWRVP